MDSCVGRDGKSQIKKATVVRIERVENMRLWKQYWHRKRELVETHKVRQSGSQTVGHNIYNSISLSFATTLFVCLLAGLYAYPPARPPA